MKMFKHFDQIGVEIEIEDSLTHHDRTDIEVPISEKICHIQIQHFWMEEKDGLKKISCHSLDLHLLTGALSWSIRDFVDAFSGPYISSTRNSPFYYDFDLDYDYVQDHDSEENFRLIGILGSAF
jgi:hypothetical protein